jgi:hypothetical protein
MDRRARSAGRRVGRSELRRAVNCTARELASMSADASARVRRRLERLAVLREKSQREWDDADARLAAEAVEAVTALSTPKSFWGVEVGDTGYSRRHIALRSWGHDPSKASSPLCDGDAYWLRRYPRAVQHRRNTPAKLPVG